MVSIFINKIIKLTNWLALLTMGFMVLLITTGVISRALFKPIIGDVELIQLSMIILIMCGLSYTEKVNGHISIGLVVDRFPKRLQYFIDSISFLICSIVSIFIAIIFVQVGIKHLTSMQLRTDLLMIPYYPFDFLISLAFFLWGLQLLLKVLTSFKKIKEG